MKNIIKNKWKIILLVVILLIVLILLLIAIYYKTLKNREYIIYPESSIANISMDNNDIIFSLEYIDNKFCQIKDSSDYNIKISNIKLQYSDLLETIYESEQIDYNNNTNMSNNVFVNLSDNKLEIKFHIRKNDLKQVERVNLFIGKIEIKFDSYKMIFAEKSNISINIPEESYNRKIKIYKAKYANDESVELGSLTFITKEEYSTAQIKFIHSTIKETMKEYDGTTSVEDNLAIKNDSYVQDEKFNQYYQEDTNDSYNGYLVNNEGYLLECWRTFKLPINESTDNLSIHLSTKEKNVIIALED